MLIRRYWEKKTPIELRNEGKKAQVEDDYWVVIGLTNKGKKAQVEDFDMKKEWARFCESEPARELAEAEDKGNDPDYVDKFEKFWVRYTEFCCDVVDVAKDNGMDDREIFEMFEEFVDDLYREKGVANPGRIKKGATSTLSRQEEMDNFSKFLIHLEEVKAERMAEYYEEEEVKLEKVDEERNKLLKELEERRAELKRQHYEEEVKLEKEFADKFARFEKK